MGAITTYDAFLTGVFMADETKKHISTNFTESGHVVPYVPCLLCLDLLSTLPLYNLSVFNYFVSSL
jgi:hypothetical protein